MRKISLFVTLLVLVSLSCKALTPTSTETPPTAVPPVEQQPTSSIDMTAKLAELGGATCEENSDLTCVTIQVPLDHYDPSNTETIDVVFGVHPASGDRYGMFIQAFPGGPGGEGISSAYLDYISSDILDHYDIVFFDQRGIGLSNPLECPVAYANDFKKYLLSYNQAGVEGLDTPQEQQDAIDEAKTYESECVAEIGIDPAKLGFFSTKQVAEDIDTFRSVIGDEKIWLYGVSYGTAVAQTYAYEHPDRIAGMVLDGTINMTNTGEESAFSQEKAFDKVLVSVLKACNDDPDCSADMGGKDAVAIYDDLAKRISDHPIDYTFPLPGGKTVKGIFTFNEFEYTVAYQLYSLSSRMIFLKALAAANHGDLVPMLRLMYDNTTIDPATFDYLGDSTFSDTMFTGVLCTDDTYYGGTPEERVQQVIEAGQASNGTVPRLDGSVYAGLDCAYWPASPKEIVHREPLKLSGVPVLVLDATLDPATPFEEGKFVAENLDDGYLIYVEGGVHSIYGYGYSCPDDYVTDFLVSGKVPAQRETVCTDWDHPIYSSYASNLPDKVSQFDNPLDMMSALDKNFFYLPDVYYNDWSEEKSIGCTYGGTYTFAPSDSGETHTFDHCAMMKDLIINGEGDYNYDTSVYTLTVEISGAKKGNLTYTHDSNSGSITVNGEFDGKSVDLSS